MQSLLDRISQETAAIDSLMRLYQTYAEVIAAFGQIQSTLGVGIFSDGVQTKNLRDLTRTVGKSMHDAINGVSVDAELKRIISANVRRQDPGEQPEVAAVSAVGSDIVSVEEPDMRPL